MASPRVLKVLEFYQDVFQWYQTLPVMWDKGRREFIHAKNKNNLLFFYFNIFVLLGGGIIGSSMYLIFGALFQKSTLVPIDKLILITVGCFYELFGLGISVAMIFFGDLLVNAWNQLMKTMELLEFETCKFIL